MIYQIDDKYYVNISPNIYVEVELKITKDDLILVPTTRQREINKTYEIKQIYFLQEKEKLKEKLLNKNTTNDNLSKGSTTDEKRTKKSFGTFKINSTNNKRW